MPTFSVQFSAALRRVAPVAPRLRRVGILALATLSGFVTYAAGVSREQVTPPLSTAIQSPRIPEYQLQRFILSRVSSLPVVANRSQWVAASAGLREKILNDVIFHGWPRQWVHAPLKFEEVGPASERKGYRLRKIRYEIVPGMMTSALIYEPLDLRGRVPAIINPQGHVRPLTDPIGYRQIRCINFARQGMIAVSPQWIGFGELGAHENKHDFGGHLDLAGANAAGLFYLAIRKALDYLDRHPNVDRGRIGITGLSGGGWQTIMLGALDPRVFAAAPVAGYGSLASNAIQPHDTSEVEEDATDLRDGHDYTHLTALRAPRPTLLIYNAEDSCCFRSEMVKPDLFEGVLPIFRLYGNESNLGWHENIDPGNHNYELDNRLAVYGFFSTAFGRPAVREESPADSDVLPYTELRVELPKENRTILSLAKSLAESHKRESAGNSAGPGSRPEAQRARLRRIIRYEPVDVQQAWLLSNTKRHFESRSYRLEFSNGLSATAVWMKEGSTPGTAPLSVLIHDGGKAALVESATEHLNRGEQVLALDLLFFGDAKPEKPAFADYALILASCGRRPLGLEAAQLLAAARYFQKLFQAAALRLESTGMRSQVVALTAAAAESGVFSEVRTGEGVSSLRYLLEGPVEYRAAPDLFCLDLYKDFDLDALKRLGDAGATETTKHPKRPIRALIVDPN
jgi:dienelactone hydrolase